MPWSDGDYGGMVKVLAARIGMPLDFVFGNGMVWKTAVIEALKEYDKGDRAWPANCAVALHTQDISELLCLINDNSDLVQAIVSWRLEHGV